MALAPRETEALTAFRQWLVSRFGPRLHRVRLFGSLARGERHDESDLDVAIEIDDLTSEEAREVGYASGDILTQYGVLVSPFVVSTAYMAHLRMRERIIALDIERDGIPI